MKNITAKLLIAFTVIFLSWSLHSSAQGFRLGVKAGADMHKLQGTAFEDGFNFGYHAGGFVQLRLSEKLMLNPEVYFSQLNLSTADNIRQIIPEVDTQIRDISLKYLNIPLLIGYKLGKGITLLGGPQYGILMSEGDLLTNGKKAFKSGDFSLVGGIQIGFAGVSVYGRYVVGMNDINDATDQGSWKSQIVHFGLAFPIL
jgi:hypothetical protein